MENSRIDNHLLYDEKISDIMFNVTKYEVKRK